MSDRDEFEAWALSEGWLTQDLDRHEGQYVYPVVKCMYEGWQAARRWDIRKTSDQRPEEDQEVLYWMEPFGKWFLGRFDGEWTFYTKLGFCDGHDAPYWMPVEALPEPPNE